jgi:hypothetical protein
VRFSFRQTERDRIVDILDGFDGTLDEAAKTVWDASIGAFLERELWIVVVNDPGVCVHSFGPYPTKTQANKAIKDGEVFAASAGARGLVMKIKNENVEKFFAENCDLELF